MKFIKWFLMESWFWIAWVLGLIIFVLTWSPAIDKTIAISFLSLVFAILCFGKYNYWRKYLKNEI
jgi:hypothetical protein